MKPVIVSAVVFAVCIGTVALLAEEPKPPATASAAIRQAHATILLQWQLLQAQERELRRQACEDAGIRFASCRVDWESGSVTEAKPQVEAKPEKK